MDIVAVKICDDNDWKEEKERGQGIYSLTCRGA